jgi:hypothetical protein
VATVLDTVSWASVLDIERTSGLDCLSWTHLSWSRSRNTVLVLNHRWWYSGSRPRREGARERTIRRPSNLLRHTGSVSDPPFLVANLGDRPPGEWSQWSRRYKANVARLKSREPDQVAEVVAYLTERDTNIGLSQGEKRMLNRAIEMLEELEEGT